jgi:hypothetical protein
VCEIMDKDNACVSNPCQNGGQCQLVKSLSDFQCVCNPGYTGIIAAASNFTFILLLKLIRKQCGMVKLC